MGVCLLLCGCGCGGGVGGGGGGDGGGGGGGGCKYQLWTWCNHPHLGMIAIIRTGLPNMGEPSMTCNMKIMHRPT